MYSAVHVFIVDKKPSTCIAPCMVYNPL